MDSVRPLQNSAPVPVVAQIPVGPVGTVGPAPYTPPTPPTAPVPVRLEGPATSVSGLMPVSVPSVLGTQQAQVPTSAPAPIVLATSEPAKEEESEPGMLGGLLNNLIGENETEVPGTQQVPGQQPVAPVPAPTTVPVPEQLSQEQVPGTQQVPGPVEQQLPGPESQAQTTGGFLSNLFGETPAPAPALIPVTAPAPTPGPTTEQQPISTGFTPSPVSYTFQTPMPVQQELEQSSFLPAPGEPETTTGTDVVSDGREYDLDIGDADEFLPDEEAEPLEDITFIDDQPPVLSTSVLPEQQGPRIGSIATAGAAGIMGGAIDKIMKGEIYEGQPPLESWSDLLPMWAWALIFFLLGAAFVGILYALTRPMEPEPQPLPPPGPPLPPQPEPQPQPAPPANRKIYCLIGEDEGRRVVVRVSDASLCRRTVLLTDEEYENSL